MVVQFINGRASARDVRRDLNSNRRQNSKFEHSNRRDGTSNHFHVGRHHTLPIGIPFGDTAHVSMQNITLLRSLPIFQGTLVSFRGTGLVRTAISTPEKEMTTVRFAPFPSCVGVALAGFSMWIHARASVHLHSSPPYPARRALTCQNRQMSVGGERGRRHARPFPRRSPPHADFCSCR